MKKKAKKKKKEDYNLKNILIIAGFAIILIIALILIFSKASLTGGIVNEKVKATDCGEDTTFYKGDTGLCWQKSVMPGTAKNWEEANNYCENINLGNKNDWRLPTLEELRKIVKEDAPDIKIDESVFRDTEKRHYWTSTMYKDDVNNHWYIHFEMGYEGHTYNFKDGYGARCVRTNSIS